MSRRKPFSHLVPCLHLKLRESQNPGEVCAVGRRQVLLRVEAPFQAHELQLREDGTVSANLAIVGSCGGRGAALRQ